MFSVTLGVVFSLLLLPTAYTVGIAPIIGKYSSPSQTQANIFAVETVPMPPHPGATIKVKFISSQYNSSAPSNGS